MDLNIIESFPNIQMALRFYLFLMVTNCSRERSFSLLRRLKNVYRFNISQEHLNEIAILSVESEILKTLNVEY